MVQNSVTIEFVKDEKLTKRQKDAVAQLKLAVYPLEPFHQRLYRWLLRRFRRAFYPRELLPTLPERRYKWASPQWSVLITYDDEVTTKVGMLVREIISNGASKKIGGICTVMTHPARRRRGLMSLGMEEATRRFHDELNVSYALLFCRPPLVPLYERLMWKPFEGSIFVDQPEGRINFTSKGPMVLDVREKAPLNGTLNLNGLPW